MPSVTLQEDLEHASRSHYICLDTFHLINNADVRRVKGRAATRSISQIKDYGYGYKFR